MSDNIHGAPGADPDPPTAAPIDDRSEAQKVEAVLHRVVEVARREGLVRTADLLDESIKMMGYEAAGFRIPRCTDCLRPVADVERVQKINRDRVVSG